MTIFSRCKTYLDCCKVAEIHSKKDTYTVYSMNKSYFGVVLAHCANIIEKRVIHLPPAQNDSLHPLEPL